MNSVIRRKLRASKLVSGVLTTILGATLTGHGMSDWPSAGAG